MRFRKIAVTFFAAAIAGVMLWSQGVMGQGSPQTTIPFPKGASFQDDIFFDFNHADPDTDSTGEVHWGEDQTATIRWDALNLSFEMISSGNLVGQVAAAKTFKVNSSKVLLAVGDMAPGGFSKASDIAVVGTNQLISPDGNYVRLSAAATASVDRISDPVAGSSGTAILVLECLDSNLTIIDTDGGGANTVNLPGTSADFSCAADETLALAYSGATQIWHGVGAAPAGGNGVGGSGTLNTLAKWTPDGSTLGDSNITDDGTNVVIGGNELEILTSLGYVSFGANSDLFIIDDPAEFDVEISMSGSSGVMGLFGDGDLNSKFHGAQFNPAYDFTGAYQAGENTMQSGVVRIKSTLVPLTSVVDITTGLGIELTNANHTAGRVRGISIGALVGDAEAEETALVIARVNSSGDTGWDNFLKLVDHPSGIDANFHLSSLTAERTYTFPDATGTVAVGAGTANNLSKFLASGAIADSSITDDGSIVDFTVANITFQDGGSGAVGMTSDGGAFFLTADADMFTFLDTSQDSLFQLDLNQLAGTSGSFLSLTGEIPVMSGNKTYNFLSFVAMISGADHTGTGNSVNGIVFPAYTADDDAVESALNVGGGWDFFLRSAIRTAGTLANSPTQNQVGLYFDEASDRGAGTATPDCALVARLSDGTEIAMTPILVVDGGCP